LNYLRYDKPPSLTILSRSASGQPGPVVQLSGQWTALSLALDHARGGITNKLREIGLQARAWDLSGIERIDHVGGQALWQTWGRKLPPGTALSATQQEIFGRIARLEAQCRSSEYEPETARGLDPVTRLGFAIFGFVSQLRDSVALLGGFVLNLLRLCRQPKLTPWREISANVYSAGAHAMPIIALVAFLIGIVLSYLSAQQLKVYGASTFVVNILGLSVIRELGPVLAAILVAGRSGSAITAQLGVMRVTEELDAMRVMGISHGMRLILPRVLALGIAMPLLITWTDIVALTGGMLAAHFGLDIDFAYFLQALPAAVPIANIWIGLGKGMVFGMLIALVACHYGFRIKPNSRSLGEGTTTSVVVSITVVIIADACFAIAFQGIGYS
jgi:phospholipid/cholesterol/gamma-HCH transport system permease protein